MRLAEIIGLRPVPAAGLFVTLTRRCPLSCAHCSTSSGPRGEDGPAGELRAFVGGFTARDRPEVLMLTGGEPLLRPALVGDLAALAQAAGTRVAVLSGMFFARGGEVPRQIMRALRNVDHFSASIDAFHEREVPRAAVFRAVHRIMDSGIDVSFHVVGETPDDPYTEDVTGAIRTEFRDRAAMLVNHVRPVGRAAGWAAARSARLLDGRSAGPLGERSPGPLDGRSAGPREARPSGPLDGRPSGPLDGRPARPPEARSPDTWDDHPARPPEAHPAGPQHQRPSAPPEAHPAPPGTHPVPSEAHPCPMAAWPVVAFDGTVVACCNQRVVDARPVPEHLRLGHIAEDDWARIRSRCQESPVLRTVRTAGVGSCATCRGLARRPAALEAARRSGARPAAGAVDALAARLQREAGPEALVKRYGSARYAPLVLLGEPSDGGAEGHA
ncbi:radical SAM protein [Streptomyces sp. NPDC093252]|uniref:radical SAM protein n=1 Tax=Streptomyces sp. NPDC093252 TaxID=3154980 RepID=UPI0034375EF4